MKQIVAPRTVEMNVRVTLPAGTPMLAVASALTQLAEAVNGSWRFRKPAAQEPGYFHVAGDHHAPTASYPSAR